MIIFPNSQSARWQKLIFKGRLRQNLKVARPKPVVLSKQLVVKLVVVTETIVVVVSVVAVVVVAVVVVDLVVVAVRVLVKLVLVEMLVVCVAVVAVVVMVESVPVPVIVIEVAVISAFRQHWVTRSFCCLIFPSEKYWESIVCTENRKNLSSHRLFGIYWEVISSMIVVILSTLNGTLEFGSMEPRSTTSIAVIYTNPHEKYLP